MELVRFCAAVVKIVIALALIGQLKSCTLELLGLAAEKSGRGMISYSKYTRALTKEPNYKPKSREQKPAPGHYGENHENENQNQVTLRTKTIDQDERSPPHTKR